MYMFISIDKVLKDAGHYGVRTLKGTQIIVTFPKNGVLIYRNKSTPKMEKSNLEIKEEFLRKIEDIKNSCESLVEKVGHLQVDLFNHPDKNLEKALDKLNNDFSNDHVFISELCESYENEVAGLR